MLETANPEPVGSEQKLERILREHQLGRISRRDAIETLGITKQEYEGRVKNYKIKNYFQNIVEVIQEIDSDDIYYARYSDLIEKYNLRGSNLTRKIKRRLEKLSGGVIGKIEGLFKPDEEGSDKSRLKNLLDEVIYKKAMYAVRKLSQYNAVFEHLSMHLFETSPIMHSFEATERKKTELKEEYKKRRKQLKINENEPHSFKQYFLDKRKMFASDYNKLRRLIKNCLEVDDYAKATGRMIFGNSFNDLSQEERNDIYGYWKLSGQDLPKTNTIKKYHLRSNNVLQMILDEGNGWIKCRKEEEIPQLA